MILCTTSDFNENQIIQLEQITKKEVWQGKILSVPLEIKNKIEILLTYGNYNDMVTEAELDILPNLKWIQSMSSGTEQLPLKHIAKRKILLTSARGVHALPISEYVFAMLLYFEKRIRKYQYLKDRMVWNYTDEMNELYGKKIGILGTGTVGSEVAKKAHAFGMIPLGLNSNGRAVEGFENVCSIEKLDKLLPQCEYICSALPSNPKTINLINKERIELFKEGIIFVNVGRGDLIVEEDFIQALQTGRIRGAALDVFRDEPLEYDHPLWHLENLVITPHASSKTSMYLPRVIDIFAKNYKEFMAGCFEHMTNKVVI